MKKLLLLLVSLLMICAITSCSEDCSHNPVVDPAIEPTCTQSGFTSGIHCSLCNAVIQEQEIIEPKGHVEVIDEGVSATCTSTGLTEGKHCSVCNAVIKKQRETSKIPCNDPNGFCLNCNSITDPVDAIIYYTKLYGRYSNGDYIYVSDVIYLDSAECSFVIDYDTTTDEIIFAMSYDTDTSSSFIMCSFVYRATKQTILGQSNISNTELFGTAEVYTATFNVDTHYIYSWDCNIDYLSSSYKDLFSSLTSLMFSGIDAVLTDFNENLTIESIGFTNFHN